MKNCPEIDFVTPYDHLDYYKLDFHKYNTKIQAIKDALTQQLQALEQGKAGITNNYNSQLLNQNQNRQLFLHNPVQ